MTEKYVSIKNKVCSFEKVRPIIAEKHDFSASLYKNKNQEEPVLHVCAKGGYDIDVLKVGAVVIMALAALSVANAANMLKTAKYERLKKINARLKAEKNLRKK